MSGLDTFVGLQYKQAKHHLIEKKKAPNIK